jgi:hypothetical protein
VGLFFRPRGPLVRMAAGATTATVAYRAGQRQAEQDVDLELDELGVDPTGLGED